MAFTPFQLPHSNFKRFFLWTPPTIERCKILLCLGPKSMTSIDVDHGPIWIKQYPRKQWVWPEKLISMHFGTLYVFNVDTDLYRACFGSLVGAYLRISSEGSFSWIHRWSRTVELFFFFQWTHELSKDGYHSTYYYFSGFDAFWSALFSIGRKKRLQQNDPA